MLIKPTNLVKMKDRHQGPAPAAEAPKPHVRTSLFQILWRRRLTVAITFAIALLAGKLYLQFATPVYTASAQLFIERGNTKSSEDFQSTAAGQDRFLPTQVEIIRSAPVLQAALDEVRWTRLNTFKKVEGDPLDWLWRNPSFRVKPGTADNTVSVAMDSEYPQEGADFVNAVVKAFVQRQTAAAGGGNLELQRSKLESELAARTQAMLTFKAENGNLSFKDQGNGNIILQRMASLSSLLNATEAARLDLQAQDSQAKAVLESPESIARYMQAQQNKGKDFGDRSYSEMRNELSQCKLKLASYKGALDTSNPRVQALQAYTEQLERSVAEKEKSIAEANAADIAQQLTATQEKEKAIRSELESQQKLAAELNAKTAQYEQLAADVDRLQKQIDAIASRIKTSGVNNQEANSPTVSVLAPARAEATPSGPSKAFVLSTAGLLGLLFGSGFAMLREYRDRRFHSVEECAALLNIPVLGAVPQLNPAFSMVDCGQIAQRDPLCEASEAYRTIRTALQFGATSAVKCVLVTSPTPGDGKSITASNLAIAMAQAGHRTLLIDADLRRPSQQALFQISADKGLSTVLGGECNLEQATYETPIPGLSLLPSGPIPINASELLSSAGFAEFVDLVGDSFDRVVIDSSPVLPVADAKAVATTADAVVLVVRMDTADRKAVQRAMEGLKGVGANMFGWIANSVPAAELADYAGYFANYQMRSAAFTHPPDTISANDRLLAELLRPSQDPQPRGPMNKVA